MNIPFRSIGRSLLVDLLLPWTISAVLLVLIGLMVWGFGLIAWPIAFVAFIFYAKQHQLARDARLHPVPRDALPSDEGVSAEEHAIAHGRMQERNKS